MKKILLVAFLAIVSIGFYSCDEDDPKIDDKLEVKSETLSMGAGYANDIYYSLSNGVVSEVSRTTWDIAFNVDAMSSSILINEGAGVVLKEFPTDAGWQWVDAIDTTGYSEWTSLYNGDEKWEDGAFGANATSDELNYGWGNYNMVSHNVEGVALYVIKLRNGDYKQIFIEVKQSVAQTYIFKYANIDGSDQQSVTIDVSDSDANFVYYDLESKLRVDREPDAATWDLLFTKYIDNSISYNVSGVLQNMDIHAIDEDDVLDLTLVDYLDTDFDDDITEIGYDWKDIDMTTYEWIIDDDRMYFVKDKNDKIYKIVFTSFGGQTDGNIGFDITAL
ncbi:MAG: hypothetical protein JEY96_08345 [Bacteroidales bacterium]|nr:hypothetical protein [Bacteroidales bacterium]